MQMADDLYGWWRYSLMLQYPHSEYATYGSADSGYTVTVANYRDCIIQNELELWSLVTHLGSLPIGYGAHLVANSFRHTTGVRAEEV